MPIPRVQAAGLRQVGGVSQQLHPRSHAVAGPSDFHDLWRLQHVFFFVRFDRGHVGDLRQPLGGVVEYRGVIIVG